MSWTPHSLLLLDWDRYGTYTGTQQAMNTAIGGILRAFGYLVDAVRVGRRLARHRPPRRDPGAGR